MGWETTLVGTLWVVSYRNSTQNCWSKNKKCIRSYNWKVPRHQVWLDPGAERITLGICFVFWLYFPLHWLHSQTGFSPNHDQDGPQSSSLPSPWLSHPKGKRVSFWSSSKRTRKKVHWLWLARFEPCGCSKPITVARSVCCSHWPVLGHWLPSQARGWLTSSELSELMTKREERLSKVKSAC